MVTKSDVGKIGEARGKVFNPPLEFPFTWEEYDTEATGEAKADAEAEFIKAKGELSLQEQMKVRNNTSKNNARNKAQNAFLDKEGIEKPNIENSEYLRFEAVFDGLMASKKYTKEAATDIALKALQMDAVPTK